jgi:hypothetical protein
VSENLFSIEGLGMCGNQIPGWRARSSDGNNLILEILKCN